MKKKLSKQNTNLIFVLKIPQNWQFALNKPIKIEGEDS
jgi:hypothetical protein